MKGFIKRTLAVACVAGGISAFTGCEQTAQEKYSHCVDPCWIQRYTSLAAAEVNEPFAAQVHNGHVLDQTVWNYYFESGTDRLNPGGQYELTIRARRRPQPDCKLYLQTAQDLVYDQAAPERLVTARADLDARRVAAVLRYLQAQTANRPVPWDVTVHDPGEVGLSAVPMQASIVQRNGAFVGVLAGPGGGGGGGGGRTGP